MKTTPFGLKLDDEFGLSFILLIDGRPINEYLGDGNGGIPYWIAQEGIPTWPPTGEDKRLEYRILTVCACGECGCSHSRSRVEIRDEVVRLYDFAGDCELRMRGVEFVIDRRDFENVCAVIADNVSRYGAAA